MRIYIAGPYAPKNCSLHDAPRVAHQNVNRAIDAFHMLKAQCHEPFVPHMSHYLHIAGGVDYSDWWYQYDLTFLRHWAEAIYLLRGWQDSAGARQELEEARRLGLAVMTEEAESVKFPYLVICHDSPCEQVWLPGGGSCTSEKGPWSSEIAAFANKEDAMEYAIWIVEGGTEGVVIQDAQRKIVGEVSNGHCPRCREWVVIEERGESIRYHHRDGQCKLSGGD